MKKNLFIVTILSFIMLCFFSFSALAIMKGMSTKELTKLSEAVIEGRVESVEAQWSKDGKTIFTSAYIVVGNVIKGVTDQKIITVEYQGGEIGDTGLKVSDEPTLEEGEQVILFLKSGKSKKDGPAYNIVGKSQGKYVIGADGIAKKSGFSTADGQENIDNNIPVDQLIEKVRRVK